jgi:hypothetical protein
MSETAAIFHHQAHCFLQGNQGKSTRTCSFQVQSLVLSLLFFLFFLLFLMLSTTLREPLIEPSAVFSISNLQHNKTQRVKNSSRIENVRSHLEKTTNQLFANSPKVPTEYLTL